MKHALAILLLLAPTGCKRHSPARRTPGAIAHAPRIAVPRAPSPIEIDGESEEDAWHHAARTGDFQDPHGAPMRPFTEAMFSRDDRSLYVHLYAADDDLRAPRVGADGPVWLCDRFRLTFPVAGGDRVIEVTPRGEIADALGGDRAWSSGARAGADTDGTIDDPRDDDEEWVIELQVPLAALGEDAKTGELPILIERNDVGGKEPRRRALGYAAVLVLR